MHRHARSSNPTDPRQPPLTKDRAKLRVLIVEDEAVVAMDLQDLLEANGATVVGVADTGARALALAASHRPDVVLMDVRLKGETDGVETARAIRRLHDIPIVFTTGNTEPDTLRRMHEIGGEVVSKPYAEAALCDAIRRAAQGQAA